MVGVPATAALILTISEDGDNLTITSAGTRVDGVPINDVIVVAKAGGPAKVTGSGAYDSLGMTRPDSRTLEWTASRQGQVGARLRYSLSPDGGTLPGPSRASAPKESGSMECRFWSGSRKHPRQVRVCRIVIQPNESLLAG